MAFCPPLTGRSEKVQSSARMISMFGFAIALICRSKEENRSKTGFILKGNVVGTESGTNYFEFRPSVFNAMIL